MNPPAVAETTAAQEYPKNFLERSYLTDPTLSFEDRCDVLFSDFWVWHRDDNNRAKPPNLAGRLFPEEYSIPHIDIVDQEFQARYFELEDIGPGFTDDQLDTELLPYEEIMALYKASMTYWLGRYTGEIPPGTSESELLEVCRIKDKEFQSNPHSIFERGPGKMKSPQLELIDLFTETSQLVDLENVPSIRDSTMLKEALLIKSEYSERYEIRNHLNGWEISDVCPEQELILNIAILPLLYILEKEYEKVGGGYDNTVTATDEVQSIALEAMHLYSRFSYFSFPDLSMRLLDISTAILEPQRHRAFMGTVVDHFNTPEQADELYADAHQSIPPFEVRYQSLQVMIEQLSLDKEFATDRKMTITIPDESGASVDFILSLHGGRFLVDSGKGSKLIRSDGNQGLPRKGMPYKTEDDGVFDLEELAAEGVSLAVNIMSNPVGNGQLSDSDVIPRSETTNPETTSLSKYLRRFKVPTRDFSGLRFVLHRKDGEFVDTLSKTTALRLYAEIATRFENVGINLLGISKIFGKEHGYPIREAMHCPAIVDNSILPVEKRNIYYRDYTGKIIKVAPMVYNGAFEIQVVLRSSTQVIPKHGEQRKRHGEPSVGEPVIIEPHQNSTGKMMESSVLDTIEPFYIVIGPLSRHLNYPETLGRALGVVLNERRMIRIPPDIMSRNQVAVSLFESAADYFFSDYERAKILLIRQDLHTLPISESDSYESKELMKNIFRLMTFLDDKKARSGYIRLIETMWGENNPKILKSIVESMMPLGVYLTPLMFSSDGEARYYSDYEPMSVEMVTERLIQIVSRLNAVQPYLIKGESRSVRKTPEIKIHSAGGLSHEYKMLIDLTLFALSTVKYDIPYEKVSYIDDVELEEVGEGSFAFLSAKQPLTKLYQLLYEGDCSLVEVISCLAIATVILNSDFFFNETMNRQGIESLRRNPTNFLFGGNNDLLMNKFASLRSYLSKEILNEYRRLRDTFR